MNISILDAVIKQLRGMPESLQQQVLDFVQTLKGPTVEGVPGSQFLRFAGTISQSDLELMREAIQQDCEQVDLDEW